MNRRNEKENKSKIEFEKLDLTNTIKEIYESAIQKAFDDYIIEIDTKRKQFLANTYTEEQAQEKFNYFTDQIRIDFENDETIYNIIIKELQNTTPEATIEEKQYVIIYTLCNYIDNEIYSFSEKLRYIENLHEEIYQSSKTHRQFLFFKELANKQEKAKEVIITKPETIFLKDIFRVSDNYNSIITLLTDKKLISILDNETFVWNGDHAESNLTDLKLLGTLAYVLKSKNYFIPNITKKEIAISFSNTFPDSKLSEAYYGQIETSISNRNTTSKEEDYYSYFYFINSL
ncbi:hypothetical protein [Wenyingzhuangia marina]|nr:hypothetical protein [Wenyingzhuangia marina]